MYEIELSKNAQKFLDKLNLHIKKRIENRLKKLKQNPIPNDSKFIKKENNTKSYFSVATTILSQIDSSIQ